MARRGENIYKRKDGWWEGRYIAEYGYDGKAKYKSIYAHTYNEVKEKMRLLNHAEKTNHINATLIGWIENYLNLKKYTLKLSTINLYKRYLDRHIKPFFKGIALKKLNRDMLQAFADSLNDKSPSTAKGIFSFLREALKLAHKNNYITPIWLGIELQRSRKHDVEVFTKEEQRLIENVLNIEENPADLGIWICLYTGLRIGEVCGLRWEDIDFSAKNLSVNRTIQRMTINGKSILKELSPKSEASRRKIPLPSFLADKLLKAKEKNTTQYVLYTDSHMMDPRTFQYQYRKTLERAGVRYLNAHTLRHTFSVRALEVGFDIKTLSEILGHADATITLKTYAHSLDEHKRNSMERLGTAIS